MNEEVKKEFQEMLTKFKDGLVMVTPEQLAEKMKAVEDVDTELKALHANVEKALAEQGEKLQLISEQRKSVNATQVLRDAIVEKKAEFTKAAESRTGFEAFKIELKAIDSSSFTNNDANFTDPYISEYVQGNPFLYDLFSNKISVPAGNQGSIEYWYQDSPTNNADSVAENGEQTESSYSWTRETLDWARISAKVKVSQYQLSDMNFVNSQVRNLLAKDFMLAIQDQLMNGAGAGYDAYGILNYATAFAASTYANTVVEADLVDMVNTVKRQIIENGKNAYNPNMGFCKHKLLWDLQILKDDFGRRKYENVAMNGGMPNISGISLMTNELTGSGDLVIGDFSKAKLYMWDGIALDVFQEDDDRSKKLVTLQIDARMNLLVHPNDTNAIVKITDFDTDLATITAPADAS